MRLKKDRKAVPVKIDYFKKGQKDRKAHPAFFLYAPNAKRPFLKKGILTGTANGANIK